MSSRRSVPRPPPGGLLVLFPAGGGDGLARRLRRATGVRLSRSEHGGAGEKHGAIGQGVFFGRLDTALVYADADQRRALGRFAGANGLLIERERHLRPAVVRGAFHASLRLPLRDTRSGTWGLRASGVLDSSYSGRGVRLAILDTGLDLEHPDFSHRAVRSRSFVAGLPVHDRNGHGTCCAGIAVGPARPRRAARYGVAPEAELYVAKVLDDDANGTDGNVLAGIDWAVRKGCAVISISLGTPAGEGGGYSRVFERIAARALAAGSLLVAPAGNASQRPDSIAPVDHPANCPSVLGVGALNQSLALASFSNGGPDPRAGGMDLAAAGTAVLSAAPRPTLYQVASGTSIAAPLVAGVAALIAEASPGARGATLRALLLKNARPLPARARSARVRMVCAP
ncbi:MAG TPA: S8 family serine peptidase [Steroidobacteraceae bacterium]|nr:S8 family serine peptidase [Steroidobacteraceae bacterium]